MRIQILGSGCPKCLQLAANAEAAVSEAGIECEIVKVTEIDEILAMGVMLTPALAIDGAVKSVGKVLPVSRIRELLTAS
ncbi:MAG: thioredoxin family protein [Kiritimatiellaeota bacterium]|nr:thioredoxin family protein [Kiritimatiellota bacterium]